MKIAFRSTIASLTHSCISMFSNRTEIIREFASSSIHYDDDSLAVCHWFFNHLNLQTCCIRSLRVRQRKIFLIVFEMHFPNGELIAWISTDLNQNGSKHFEMFAGSERDRCIGDATCASRCRLIARERDDIEQLFDIFRFVLARLSFC